jgi:hypothetical protein
MATEKKSIEISYKANLADLKAKLKTIPNITDAEAKKMVAALDRQLKQAEKAAKKSSEASKKAAKEAAMAARKGSSDFDKMGAAAARAEQRLEGVADASGDIDRGFSSVGLALRNVNPQLAEAADGLADAFAVGEGLLLTFTSLNPIVVAAGAAIGALTLGFVAYTDSIEKAREKTIAMRDAQKSLSEQYQEIGKNLEDARKKLGDQRDSLDIATGAISEYDAALLQASKTAEQSFQGNIDAQKRIIKERQDDLKLIERIISGDKAISDSEKERIRNLQLITKNSNNNLDILANGRYEDNARHAILVSVTNEIENQKKALKIIEGFQSEAVELARTEAEFRFEQAEDAERQAKAQERKNKADQDSAETAEEEAQRLQELMDKQLQGFQNRKKYNEELDKARKLLHKEEVKLLGTEEEQINEKYDNEIKRLKELAEKAQDKSKLNEMIAKTEEDRDKEQHQARLARIQKEMEEREKGFKIFFDQISAGTAALQEMAVSREEEETKRLEKELEMQHAQEMGEANRIENAENRAEAIKALEIQQEEERAALEERRAQAEANAAARYFAIQKAVSVAEATMNTAKGIINALATYPGPVGIGLSALMAATGAAQVGAIMSQQPPSFHMGGLASDEANARVLKGEAVLDRATVRRIGGEQGVKQLQQGGASNNNVVIVQPFKHFGRFAREIGFKKPRQTGMRGY